MSVTVENWYVVSGVLHWWMRGADGTSRGKDHLGRAGNFIEGTSQIRSWNEYDEGIFMFSDGNRRYIAALKTHYSNPRYPAQCIENKEALLAKLAGIPRG